MFINKTSDGKNNICGKNIAILRTEMKISQRALAEKLQVKGLDIDKNAIQRIEAGKRFVTDIELKIIADFFDTSMDKLTEIKWGCCKMNFSLFILQQLFNFL